MASSRLEKVGTIYSRTKGLIQTGALKWEDRPLWYDIYEAFPPKEEPCYDRPAPNVQIKKIFYEEDRIRAIFHRSNKHVGTINMFNNESTTLTKRFIDVYKKLEEQYAGTASEQKIYEEAVEMLRKDRNKVPTSEDDHISLSSAFKEALSKSKQDAISISIKDIFKN